MTSMSGTFGIAEWYLVCVALANARFSVYSRPPYTYCGLLRTSCTCPPSLRGALDVEAHATLNRMRAVYYIALCESRKILPLLTVSDFNHQARQFWLHNMVECGIRTPLHHYILTWR